MSRRNRTQLLLMSLVVLTTAVNGQGQPGGRGRGALPPGAPVAGPGRGGPPAGPPPKALIPTARPVRTCESLAAVELPDTAIESATVDPNNPALCRVTAVTTHPPAGDKVRIWVAIPLSNWNGRFMGNGGG